MSWKAKTLTRNSEQIMVYLRRRCGQNVPWSKYVTLHMNFSKDVFLIQKSLTRLMTNFDDEEEFSFVILHKVLLHLFLHEWQNQIQSCLKLSILAILYTFTDINHIDRPYFHHIYNFLFIICYYARFVLKFSSDPYHALNSYLTSKIISWTSILNIFFLCVKLIKCSVDDVESI